MLRSCASSIRRVALVLERSTHPRESKQMSGAKGSSAANSSFLEPCDMLDGLARRPSLATLSPCHATNCAAPLQCPFFFPCCSRPGWANLRKGLCFKNEHERSSLSASCAQAQAPAARGYANADGQACKWYYHVTTTCKQILIRVQLSRWIRWKGE